MLQNFIITNIISSPAQFRYTDISLYPLSLCFLQGFSVCEAKVEENHATILIIYINKVHTHFKFYTVVPSFKKSVKTYFTVYLTIKFPIKTPYPPIQNQSHINYDKIKKGNR
jgi:hypothetical protein